MKKSIILIAIFFALGFIAGAVWRQAAGGNESDININDDGVAGIIESKFFASSEFTLRGRIKEKSAENIVLLYKQEKLTVPISPDTEFFTLSAGGEIAEARFDDLTEGDFVTVDILINTARVLATLSITIVNP